MMNMMDTIKRHDEVDVFNSVKRIRKTRPEFIPNMVSLICYRLCLYDVTDGSAIDPFADLYMNNDNGIETIDI